MKAMPTTAEIREVLTEAVENLDGNTSLIAEAGDTETPPERLAELAKSADPFVQLAALKNPNAPGDAFFDAMFR